MQTFAQVLLATDENDYEKSCGNLEGFAGEKKVGVDSSFFDGHASEGFDVSPNSGGQTHDFPKLPPHRKDRLVEMIFVERAAQMAHERQRTMEKVDKKRVDYPDYVEARAHLQSATWKRRRLRVTSARSRWPKN